MITRKHLERVKKNCIICNMGHSNQEIDLDSLKDLKREKIRRNVTHITMPNGKTVVLLADVCTGINQLLVLEEGEIRHILVL